MPDIPASEYINSLLTAYQYGEKIYSQAVSDVIAAEVRRDEARKARDELLVRLENAREKYSPDGSSPKTSDTALPRANNTTPPRGRAGKISNGAVRRKQAPQPQIKNTIANAGGNEKIVPAEGPKTPTRPLQQVEAPYVAATSTLSPPFTPSGRKSIKKTIASLEANEKGIPAEAPKSPAKPKQKEEASPVPTTPTPPISSDILMSPTAGSKKPPRIFLSPGTPRKRSSRFVTLTPLEDTKPILDIAPGRTREWYEKNFDCDSCGLVKNFYKAAFGTKTNEKTQKVTVRTVVMNDEWNELVTDTSQIQEMYIGKRADKDGKPNPRDKAAEALVSPPQKEPIAFFFAPKKSQDTSLVFYGGHWKVIDGKMLNPPRAVNGQMRQCLVKFAFVGVDRLILEALDNKVSP